MCSQPPVPATDVDVVFLSAAKTPQLRQLTVQAVESLLASEPAQEIRFRPVVIESFPAGSPTGYEGAAMLTPAGEFGYHRFMNIGVKAGTAPFVAMCNNDLVFHPGWMREILRAFSADPALMSASPYCRFFHGRVLPNPPADVVPGYSNGLHVAGWCLVVRRSLFESIGQLDERFRFWYCDDDYRMTLQQHGLKHALVVPSRVDHLGSVTLGGEKDRSVVDRMTSRQALLFEYKWGHRSRILYWLKQAKYMVTRFR